MKLRGQRIELGEIEHALRALPGVDEAVVLVHADALVAYVSPADLVQADGSAQAQAAAGTEAEAVAVTAEDAAGAPGERGFGAAVPFGRVAALAGAAAALPAYMVPSVVVGVREWPRTSSAKIDRNRLPPPEGGGGAAAELVAPRSAAERAARDAIAAVLGLAAEGVSVEAGFFELGCLRPQPAFSHTALGLTSISRTAHELIRSRCRFSHRWQLSYGCAVGAASEQSTGCQPGVQTNSRYSYLWGRSCHAPHLIDTILILHRVRSPFPCKVSSCIQPPQL